MFTVYACLVGQHDYRLVLLAGALCLFASIVAAKLLQRMARSQAGPSAAALGVAAGVTGIGIWATHFIAMLAFETGGEVRYGAELTLLSLLAAVVLIAAGFQVAVGKGRYAKLLGGMLVGAAVVTMHYLGMAAFEVQGYLLWNRGLVIASVIIALVFGPLALMAILGAKGDRPWVQLGGALLLTAAICGGHFTGMGAAAIVPDRAVHFVAAGLPVHWLVVLVAGGAMTLLGLCAVAMVMEQRQRAAELRRRNDLANTAVEGLVVCDEGLITTANTSFLALVDQGERQLIGRPFAALFDDLAVADRLALHQRGGGKAERFETILRSSAGEQIPVELITRTLAFEGRMQQGIAVRDLRARRQADAQIRFLALHDPLTGLPNRASFSERLEREIERHRRKDDGFAVLCLDLDRFKQVNDVFGHGAGDMVLGEVSARIGAVLDGDDIFARLGGDEFAIIRLGPCRPADLAALGDRILAAVAPDIEIDGQSAVVGVSLGMALYPNDGDTALSLMRNADAALYRAKGDGRGAYRFFEPAIGAALRNRRGMEADLRGAIGKGELTVAYQPQTLLADGEILGFEALLRWTHPVRGAVPPDTFIPVAEETGLILPIGEWVLRSACAEAARWPKPLQIAVNLSGVQLHSAHLAALVAEVLEETGLAAERLELEITETALIADFDHALQSLRQIKALGVKIAMDDFGTGYSSLFNLRAFPFDKIKIDRSFVHGVDQNEQGAAIVRAILGLAKGLNMKVLAEGVETPEEMAFLGEELCTEAQGFLFGAAADIGEFSAAFAETKPLKRIA